MRASRLPSMLLLLQMRGRMTAEELAREMAVSVCTIYRGVKLLSAAGVPIHGDRAPAGGYQLLDALPPELRSRAGRISERFHLDAPSWFREGEELPHLATFADAVWNQRRLNVRYQRWRSEVERTLEPLGLVLIACIWCLVARCEGQDRAYRASRILDLEVRDERFERPEAFDLSTFWESWSEQFEQRLYQQEVRLRLSPRGVQMLPHLFNPSAARAAEQSAAPPDEQDWVELTLPAESLDYGHYELLRLGTEVEALSPPEIRHGLTAMAAIYQRDPAELTPG